MKINRKITLGFVLAFFIIAVTQCDKNNSANSSGQAAVIDISAVDVKLPKAEGVKLVKANCGICHSLRYIEMQPDLTAKTWEKLVDKMIKNFGAPVPDSASRSAIIKYLVTIRGINQVSHQ